MNVYDFDGTIYDGESVFDFYLFSVTQQPELIKYLFVVVKTLIRYKLCRLDEQQLLFLAEKYAGAYLKELKNPSEKVCQFWDKNQHKIKPYYLTQQREDDIVISASFEILLKEIFTRIGIKQYICTDMNPDNGEVTKFCYRATKAKLFREKYPDAVVENFYTDSKNDESMMSLAQNTFFVKGNRIQRMEG